MTYRATKNLTGVWHGLYTYSSHPWMPESHFTATLIDSGAMIFGTIHEIMNIEDGTSHFANAYVEGHKEVQKLHFIKTYDGSNGQIHSIVYSGVISADANEIEGEWRINDIWKMDGRFLMIRNRGQEEIATARIAVSVGE